MDFRRIVKKISEKPSKEITNVSTLELSMASPPESNRSLLIHDSDDHDLFSNQSSSDREIHDSDIPMDKRSIINNPNYFKQLSLSFYGASQPSHKSVVRQDNVQYNSKTEASRLNTSYSPRSSKEYFYGTRRSPLPKFEKEHLQYVQSSFTQLYQKSHSNLANSKVNIHQIKGRLTEKNLGVPQPLASVNLRDLKPKRVLMQSPSPNVMRSSVKGMYPQLTTGLKTDTALTPKKINLLECKDSGPIKEIKRPSFRKILGKKLKDGHLQSEPSPVGLKTSKSSNVVPKKLKMYALDNVNLPSSKALQGGNNKIQSNSSVVKDKLPIRPSVTRIIQGLNTKRNTVTISPSIAKKLGYYD